MGYFLTALVCALIGGAPFDFGRRGWLMKWIALTGGLLAIFWPAVYLGLPSLIGPYWGLGVVIMITTGAAANAIFRAFLDADYHHKETGNRHYLTYLATAGLLLLFTVRGCAGCEMFRADEYREFVRSDHEQSDWTSDISQIDTARIRTVSEAQARRSMGIALGQAQDTSLGSRYQIGNLTIQRVGQNLVWVAPLEFTGFRTWQRYDTTAGYLIVDATNSDAEARLVDSFELRYMPSAFFGDNLERHIYANGYRFHGYTDYTFELDDDGNPNWVVTLYTPTIAYWGERIDGVLIVNPINGEMNEYSGGAIPAWVDRVVPQNFAFERLTNFGQYIQGWWNSVWGKQNIRVPTQPEGMGDMWLVWGTDDQAYWFTGLTSVNATDNSLVGFALMNSRTGHTRMYRATGSDEVDIVRAVNSEVSNYSNYQATQPILYNIYGELTWAVPIITPEGVFQRLALAHGATGRVVTGENKVTALAAYRRLLVSSGDQVVPTSVGNYMIARGTLRRILGDVRDGNTTYYLLLGCDQLPNCALTRNDGAIIEDPPDIQTVIFTGNSELSPELPITIPGDEVEVRFLETEESTVPLSAFDLTTFNSRRPDNN